MVILLECFMTSISQSLQMNHMISYSIKCGFKQAPRRQRGVKCVCGLHADDVEIAQHGKGLFQCFCMI